MGDFDDGTDEGDITAGGYWDKESDALCTYEADGQRHALSTLLYEHHGIYPTNQGIVRKQISEWSSAGTGYKFVSLWKKLDMIDIYPGQFKNERIESTSSHANPPIVIIDSWGNAANTGTSQYYTSAYNGDMTSLGRKDPDEERTDGVWYNVIFQYKESDLDTANGALKLFISSTETPKTAYWVGDWGSSLTTQTTADDVIQWLKLGYNIESGGSEAFAYYDDIYIDNSWARVEIGDQSTYANCTHREMQIPTAWADGSVSVTINRGSFGASDSVYLFVLKSDGTASSGYPVTFGSSYGSASAKGVTFSGSEFH